MPLHGCTKMVEKIVDHPNIHLILNTDFRPVKDQLSFGELIYTGPADEYFDWCFAKLPYYSLRFDHQTLDEADFQPVSGVNFSSDQAYIRITEYEKLTGQEHPKTSFTFEYPQDVGDSFYPVPRLENADLYRSYKHLADQQTSVYFVSLLDTYRYYNRDQMVAQVLTLHKKLVGVESLHIVT